jgi:heterotetrameric sarcosine oxidase gamma subunit
VSEPLARSPIAPAPPVTVAAGWEVSGRRASADPAGLTITDCTPLTKVQVRAPASGGAAAALGVPFGRAARNPAGALVVGSGPGEWLVLAPPGPGRELTAQLARLAARAPDEPTTAVDLTHGRALIRLTGPRSAAVLAKVCGIDLSDDITPDGAAFRSSVAALATDVIRDDRGGDRGGQSGGDRGGQSGGDRRRASNPGPVRSYLLHCERSSGQYLFDVLLRSGAEFGIAVDGLRPPGI